MKKNITIIIGLLLVMSGSIAFGAPRVPRLAVIFPEDLSNTNSVGNVAMCMAKAVINDWTRRGTPLSVDFFNDKRDAAIAGQVGESIVRGKFDAAIGATLSSQALILSRILDEAGIPYYAPLATHPDVVEGKKFAVRLAFSDRRQAHQLAIYATLRKPKRILILRNDSLPYSTFLAENFSEVVQREAKNVQIETLSYIDGKFDPANVVKAYRRERPDVIFAPVYSLDVASTYSALTQVAKRKVLLLGADAIGAGPTFFNAMGRESENVELAFVQHNPKEYEGPEVERMKSIFQRECGHLKFNMNAAAAFDLTESALRAVTSRHYDGTPESFKIALSKIRFHGTLGRLVFGKGGEPEKPIHIYTIRNGVEIYVETTR